MKKSHLSTVIAASVIFSGLSINAHAGMKGDDLLPEGTTVLDSRVRIIDGREIHVLKFREDNNASVKYGVFSSDGSALNPSTLAKPSVIDDSLKVKLYEVQPDERLQIQVAFSVDRNFIPSKSSGTFKDQGDEHNFFVDGKEVSKNDVSIESEKWRNQLSIARNLRAQEKEKTALSVLEEIDVPVSSDIRDQIENTASSLTLKLTKNQIERLSRHDKVIGIELYHQPQDAIAEAMENTNIDPYALDYSGRSGDGIGIYMTENGCPNTGYLTGYTRLAGPYTTHSEHVSSILRAVAEDAHIYCRGGAVLPATTDLDGVGSHPPIYIANRSNGSVASSGYVIADRDWDNLVYEDGIVHFNSAGNSGTGNNRISSPGKSLNSIAVGAHNDDTDTIASFSSHLDPTNTGNQKPELSAPGVQISAGGHQDSGTSFSSPHAAAYTADFMSSWLMLRPAATKAYLLATSRRPIAGGADAVGVGGLDFYDLYYAYDNHYWTGANNSFQGFDSEDVNPNNGFIDREFYMSSSVSSVRVAFAWLNDGDYTYTNRNGAFPMGMDMDIYVRDPNGNLVGSSTSIDNPYEIVEFDPTITGTYTVQIERSANRDTNSAFYAGLSINR